MRVQPGRWSCGRTFLSLIAGTVAVAFLITAASSVAPARLLGQAVASTWVVDTYTRTEAEIRAAWAEMTPDYTGTPYVTTPSTTAPYAPGETTVAFRGDGLRMLNFGRYLAGLPTDVTLLDSRNLDGQYGAVLLQKEYSHTPAQPADMPDDFYQRAYASTSSSNIGYGYGNLESFQKDCLYDGHLSNIARVGHRRWLLNPSMLYTGMGFAGTSYPQTMTTYAFDRSRPAGSVDYAFIAWPSAGLFPVEHAPQSVPWSITLNPARYDWDTTGHTVQLRRVSDGQTWTFDATDSDPSFGLEYFNAEFTNYGYTGNAFIFRPSPIGFVGDYRPGEQFDVTLSGGIYAEGTRTPVTVKYRTSFCALSGDPTVFTAPVTIPDATPVPEPTPDSAGPVAVADYYVTCVDTPLLIDPPGVLANDSQPDGLPLRASWQSSTRNGALVLLPDGSFRYYPHKGWSGTDTFTYKAEGPTGVYSDLQTVTITVLGTQITPVAGTTRIETAVEASKLGFSSSEYVVVATALSFPDALGGSALAGALDAPILLTYTDVLPDAVKAEIARLGATKVIVLGGDGAVSPGVYAALDALPGVTAERIAGATRYTTAEKIAERTIAEMGVAFDGTAFVATGASFPDALGASPLAAAKGWPIYLLAPQTSTHDALVAAMEADGVSRVLVLGGTGVVPASFESKLEAAFTDTRVDRLAGSDRYTTALAVARYGAASAGLAWDHLAVATGADFPDALAGGALQGADRSVMLLAAPTGLNAEVRAELTAQKASITEVRFLGGTGAVPQTIRDAVVQAIQ